MSYDVVDVIRDTIGGNVEFSSEEQIELRKAHCVACDKKILGICSECGCIVEVKVKYLWSECPDGKW